MTDCAFNLFGYLSSSIGLGTAARNTAHTLDALGVPFDSVNVVPIPPPRQQAMEPTLHVVDAGARPHWLVNLFHMNPLELMDLLSSPGARTISLDRFNVSVPFWELSELPPSWVDCLRAMDAVLAPSLFLRDMVERTIPGLPVLHFPQGVNLPKHVAVDRDRWGMPVGSTVFVCSFDLSSDMNRKNPLGAIEAFRRAFAASDPVQLFIRVNHADDPESAADMEALGRQATGSVRLVCEPLSYAEVLSLYASADVYVSLHRAEGLGLGMLEAMALGRPVVATAYSGNMDFMDAETGMLIDYELVAVQESRAYNFAVVGEHQKWADPDLDQAAAAMRALHESESLRQRMGSLACDRAAEVNLRSASGAAFEDLRVLSANTPRDKEGRERIRELQGVCRRAARRRKIVALLRAAKLKPPAPAGETWGVPVVTGPEGLGGKAGAR